MLNASEICALLENKDQVDAPLSIVPRPDVAALRARGGTSIDLRLGRWFRIFKPAKTSEAKLWLEDDKDASGEEFPAAGQTAPASWRPDSTLAGDALRTSQHFVRFGSTFVLHPGRFVLGVTLEWLTLPRTLSGYVSGKSSLGRHGLVIETAAGLHPGFSGCLTLELANVGEVPVAISPGMEICQIFLHRVQAQDAENAGTFSGQRKPAISLPKRDSVFDRLRGALPRT
jgi:dCTP deaminase